MKALNHSMTNRKYITPTTKSLGEALKIVRTLLDVPQTDFAERLGIGHSAYASLERHGLTTNEVVGLVEDALGKSAEEVGQWVDAQREWIMELDALKPGGEGAA